MSVVRVAVHAGAAVPLALSIRRSASQVAFPGEMRGLVLFWGREWGASESVPREFGPLLAPFLKRLQSE